MSTDPATRARLLESLRREGLDSVEGAFACAGGQDFDKPGLAHRRRTRLELSDAQGGSWVVFLKRYQREPWRTRLARYLAGQGGQAAGVLEAANIAAAAKAGVQTMDALAAGQDAAGRSYIVVTAVPGEALERYGQQLMTTHAADGAIDALTQKLARLARTLHAAGLVHRDFYACHVFCDDSADGLELYLIDLARVFRPPWRRFRWYVKDLAQLKFSMPPVWVERCWDNFLQAYLGQDYCGQTNRYERAIDRKVARMRRRHARHARNATEPNA